MRWSLMIYFLALTSLIFANPNPHDNKAEILFFKNGILLFKIGDEVFEANIIKRMTDEYKTIQNYEQNYATK